MSGHRDSTAFKRAYGVIRAIASSPATPSEWPPRAVLTPIAELIPSTGSHDSSAALTYITLVQRHSKDETIDVMAKSDQYRPEIGIKFADVPCRLTADPHGHWSFRPFGVHMASDARCSLAQAFRVM